MSILSRINISKRILIIGAASLLGLVLVIGLSVAQLDSALRASFNNRTKQAIDVAYTQMERFQAEEAAGRMTREQAQEAAKQAIQSMRFGDNDYYFILDTGMKMVMHPVKTKLVGKDLTSETDADGKHHYQEMVDVANSKGGGFVDYNYKMPDGSGAQPKLSYARKFQPWGWVLATGVFASEIRSAVMDAAIRLATVVAFVLAGLAGLIWVVSRSITVPLKGMIARMRSLAEGDNTSPIIGTERRDELGEMAGALATFREAAVAKEKADAAKAEADAEQQLVVSTLEQNLGKLAEGDLTADIRAEFSAGYATVKTNYNDAIARLRELIGSVAESAITIRTGSTEIAQASEDLARRTEANAASLEETSAAVAQIDLRLKASAVAAGRTVERADGAIATVSGGREITDEAVQAMTRVSESAKGIDSVIEGLDKIAFQTRVLAMNAAVEAGRAGEAGRGFAVVADLVSALAMRSEEEAARAREQLTATQTDIIAAVGMVEKVDGALANISGDVAEVHTLLNQMAADNQAQSTAITQISVAIGTMDTSTQQNAAMVEETSAAARNLNSEVSTLAGQAGRFNVGNGVTAAAAKPRRAPAAAAPILPAAPAYKHGNASGDWATF